MVRLITRQVRPYFSCSSRVPIGALVAVAILATGCRGAVAPSCPIGAPIEVALAAWTQAVEGADLAASGVPTYDALLAELGLEPLPDLAGEGTSADDGVMTLASLETVAVRRGHGETPDQLVAARFHNAGGAESLRAQLLRPTTGHLDVYCPLGDELSRDSEPFETPCLEPHDGPARSLALESLIAPDRDAIVVRDAGGWCGPGTHRGDRLATSYWGVERDRLVRYFEAVTFESWYESPAPPVKRRRGEIELSAAWPRSIALSEVVECHEHDDSAPRDCEPFEGTREYRYLENRYVAHEETVQ